MSMAHFPSLTVQLATAQDIPALSKLAIDEWRRAFAHTIDASKQKIEDYLASTRSENYYSKVIDRHLILLAKCDKRLVGFIEICHVTMPTISSTDQDREVNKLYVDGGFQSQGIGSALLKAALEHPDLPKGGSIYLDVWEKNHGAKRLYERFGFEVVGEHQPPFSSWQDFIMVRKIDQT